MNYLDNQDVMEEVDDSLTGNIIGELMSIACLGQACLNQPVKAVLFIDA